MLVRQARGQGRQARGPQASAVESLLGQAYPTGSLIDCAALGHRHLSLSEFVDYLLRRMSPLGRLSPFLRLYTNILTGPVIFGYQLMKLTAWPGSRVKMHGLLSG